MLQLKDQLDREHFFEKTPIRIVSLVPSQTETLVDLGLEEYIVGITKFCVHPKHLKKTKTIVGGTKNVNFEKIKALKPDIIIANKEENTKDIIDTLSNICSVWVTDIITLENNIKMLQDFGILFNCKEKSDEIIKKIDLELNSFYAFAKEITLLKTGYFIWKKPYMVAGYNTYVNQMMQICKLKNIFDDSKKYPSRYPEIDIENDKNLDDLELILLSSEPYPFKEKEKNELKSKFPKVKVILVDGEMFSWHGSRLLYSIKYFKELIGILKSF